MAGGNGYDDAGFVTSSKYRSEVLTHLSERPAMPKSIVEDTDLDFAHISRALNDLRDRGLVELLVPEDRRKGRIYGLTDDGEACLDTLEEMGVAE